MQVEGRTRGGLKRTWMKLVRIDLKKHNLSKDLVESKISKVHVVDQHSWKLEQGFGEVKESNVIGIRAFYHTLKMKTSIKTILKL